MYIFFSHSLLDFICVGSLADIEAFPLQFQKILVETLEKCLFNM